jgi:hypothetical protein
VQEEHQAIREADKRADAEKAESTLARSVPAAALAEWHREKANFGVQVGNDPVQIAAFERQKLTFNYEQEEKDALLHRAVMQNRLTERQADMAKMYLANPMAQAPGAEGDKVRAAIRNLANAKTYDTGLGQFWESGVSRWEHDQAAIIKGSGIGQGGNGADVGEKMDTLIEEIRKGLLLRTQ